MTTNFMNLDLPTVSTTLGPEWATKLNAALERVDLHDHSSGKGTQIPSSGLNINATLEFNNNILSELKASKFQSQSSTLTGTTNSHSLHVSGGNLYYTNAGGTAVQLTSGGSAVSTPASANNFETKSVSATLNISSGDTFVVLLVDTTSSRIINLPSVSAVADGRAYLIKDISGSANTNNITVNRAGSDTIDGATSIVLDSDFGSWWIIGDASSSWYVA